LNIEELFDFVPQKDAFINIHIEKDLVPHILPEYEVCAEQCICIYGVPELVVDECLSELTEKAEEYKNKILKSIPGDILWDIVCKPVFLFDNKQTANTFSDFANSLCEEDYLEFIDELQRDYCLPWTYVQMIRFEQIHDILEPYERRYCCD